MNYKKIIFAISFLVVFGFLFNVGAPDVKAITAAEIQALIQQLQQQIAQLQKQLAELEGKPVVWCHDFKVNLKYGMGGVEVRALQTALEKEGFKISESEKTPGARFEDFTASAVVGFQEKYKEEILAPWGLEHGTGYVGKTTRDKLNKLYGCGVVTPYIKVISPNGGERWVVGKTYNIQWVSQNLPAGNDIIISSSQSYTKIEKILFSNLDNSKNNVSWTIPINTSPGSYVISITAPGLASLGKIGDASDAPFSIVSATTPSVTVLSPNGGEKWESGKTYDITWRANGVNKTMIEVIKGNQGWHLAYNLPASQTKFSWTIPSVIGTGNDYKIHIWDQINATPEDYSDNYFSIVAQKVCASYFRKTGSTRMIQGTWTMDPNATSSIQACFNYMKQNILDKPYCVQPEGEYITIVLIDKNKHTFDMPNINMTTEFVHSQYCIVAPTPSITVLSPNGGEQWKVGETRTITWSTTGYNSNASIQIGLRDTRYSSELGEGQATIANITNTGSYTWTIPSQLDIMQLGAGNVYKIVIYIAGGGPGKFDESDNYFSIVAATPKGISLNLLSATATVTNMGVNNDKAVGIIKFKIKPYGGTLKKLGVGTGGGGAQGVVIISPYDQYGNIISIDSAFHTLSQTIAFKNTDGNVPNETEEEITVTQKVIERSSSSTGLVRFKIDNVWWEIGDTNKVDYPSNWYTNYVYLP